jgi:type IV pilus assembly protein PilA
MKNSKSGFSLVELMVVVAIIGILATIAVPNFQRFQARAKQSNAKTELSGIYTAQKAFLVEYNSFHAHLPMIGFVPEGVNGTDANSAYAAIAPSRIYATSAGLGNNETALNFVGTNSNNRFPPAPLSSNGQAMTYAGIFPAHPSGCAAAIDINIMQQGGSGIPAASSSTFQAKAVGCPKSTNQAAVSLDIWTIDQDRNLRNVRSGI